MTARGKRRPKQIFVVSDSTGKTAERLVTATMAQFPQLGVKLETVPEVTTPARVRQVVARAKKARGLIAYTLVNPVVRAEMALVANESNVDTVDLIGPLLTSLSRFLEADPVLEAGLYTNPDDEHYKQMDAVRFTVQHDDGKGMQDLEEADLVIVGPSRTSKTPLSVFLAHTRGLKVANVPLILGVDVAPQLEALKKPRIVGLTIQIELLARIRRARQNRFGKMQMDYGGQDHIRRELRFCHGIYRRHPNWEIVDITGRSIEEVASHAWR